MRRASEGGSEGATACSVGRIPARGRLWRAAARELQHAAGRKFRGAAGFGGRQLESINFTAGKVEILLAIIKFSA